MTYAIIAAVGAAFILGRLSRRPGLPDRVAVSPWTYVAVAFAFLGANAIVTSSYLVGDNRDYKNQSECRAELAAPVNDATAEITVGQARALAVTSVLLVDDADLAEQVRKALGGADLEELRQQLQVILDASVNLDEANTDRGPDPVGACN